MKEEQVDEREKTQGEREEQEEKYLQKYLIDKKNGKYLILTPEVPMYVVASTLEEGIDKIKEIENQMMRDFSEFNCKEKTTVAKYIEKETQKTSQTLLRMVIIFFFVICSTSIMSFYIEDKLFVRLDNLFPSSLEKIVKSLENTPEEKIQQRIERWRRLLVALDPFINELELYFKSDHEKEQNK